MSLKGIQAVASSSEGLPYEVNDSIYLDSLENCPSVRSIGARISSRLSRHIPVHFSFLQNERPMVSFTFDDVPESALSAGADILEKAGVYGSFYISTALMGRRTRYWTVLGADGVLELHRRKHEICLHGHVHLPVTIRSAVEFDEDLALNRKTLKSIDRSIEPNNFAYPYGQISFSKKLQLAGLVRSSRGIVPGINKGFVDSQHIKSVPLEDSTLSYDEVDRLIEQTAINNAWLVFFSHDVSDTPSPFGVSKRFLDYTVSKALRRGLDVVSMGAALNAAKVRC